MSYNIQDEFVDLEGALELNHFRTACRTSQYYSCGVDCFLEISYRLFLPEIEANKSFHELD